MTGNDARSLEPSEMPCGKDARISIERFWSLYQAYSQELLAFLMGVLGNVHDANEVSQITFYRLLDEGHTAQQETIKGWLFKLALNEAIALKRRATVRDKHFKIYARGGEAKLVMPETQLAVLEQDEIERLRRLLSELPEEQQHVVRERMYAEKSFAVIAAELNVPLSTVLTRMRIAVEKLRKWWGND